MGLTSTAHLVIEIVFCQESATLGAEKQLAVMGIETLKTLVIGCCLVDNDR